MLLLAGACSAEPAPPAPAPASSTPFKPPRLVDERVRYEGVPHVVRDVVDGRTVELVDGTKVRIAQLAAPPDCGAEGALTFARATLLARAVRVSPVLSGDVNLALEDGTDYALLAVRQGVLRPEGVDGGALLVAQAEAAAAGRGVWGPPCTGSPSSVAPTTTRAAPPRTTLPVQPPPTTTTVPPARTCAVAYRVTGQWPGGFQANVTLRNTGTAAFDGWTLRWSFPNGQVVTEMWNARARQSGAVVSAVNADYNPRIAPGESVVVGFNGSARGGNGVPGAFTVDGRPCAVE
ncbi:cellulose-binding domain-containing protein [Lentzea sp. NPDC003310]|uniref:cellulose-binding domain-containing protein n=1 Tax=Lentzea sp. NPDC003310 TaxID=3154447 RepID=UPI0033AFEA6C